jgi:hypothetical protein
MRSLLGGGKSLCIASFNRGAPCNTDSRGGIPRLATGAFRKFCVSRWLGGARASFSSSSRTPSLGDQEPRAQTVNRLNALTRQPRPQPVTPLPPDVPPVQPLSSASPSLTRARLNPRQYRRVHSLNVFSDKGLLIPDPMQSYADAPTSITRHAWLVKAGQEPTPLQARRHLDPILELNTKSNLAYVLSA